MRASRTRPMLTASARAIPAWLMNAEEVCEWLSASEQTQQPVLKAWWAYLKAGNARQQGGSDFLEGALASISEMKAALPKLAKKTVGTYVDNILSYATGGGIDPSGADIVALKAATQAHRKFDNWSTDKVDNPVAVSQALTESEMAIHIAQASAGTVEDVSGSGDTPKYFPRAQLSNASALVNAAVTEDAPRIEQFLTTLRMRLRTRLADTRWAVFTNYDALGVKSTSAWFKSLGFAAGASKVTVIDLSMLAHEVLPFACASIGRVLLEAREKLIASQRYESPWIVVLEEAHNYARPARHDERIADNRFRGRLSSGSRRRDASLVFP